MSGVPYEDWDAAMAQIAELHAEVERLRDIIVRTARLNEGEGGKEMVTAVLREGL
jgi:hypothetical protein